MNHAGPPSTAELAAMAAALIDGHHVMSLATAEENVPWCAAVYYVWWRQGLWFFSSAASRHIRQATRSGQAAAAIWADDQRWQRIEGVQLEGSLARASGPLEAGRATAAYLARFPRAASVIKALGKDRPDLWVLRPRRLVYTNNRFGLGFRTHLAVETVHAARKGPWDG